MIHRLRTMWCWITTGHTEDENEWGYTHSSGLVDLFCSNCQRHTRRIPLEDFSLMADVFELIEGS